MVRVNDFEIQYEKNSGNLKFGEISAEDNITEFLLFFQNPANGSVSIKNLTKEVTQVSIYNLNGLLILKKTLDSDILYLKTGTDLNSGILCCNGI